MGGEGSKTFFFFSSAHARDAAGHHHNAVCTCVRPPVHNSRLYVRARFVKADRRPYARTDGFCIHTAVRKITIAHVQMAVRTVTIAVCGRM